LEPHWPYIPSEHHQDGISLRDLFTNHARSNALNSTPSDSQRDSLLQLYKNTIKDVDDFIDQIKSDLADYDPVFVFHSDHGEAFGERGNWGHHTHLYDENVHVPLEIWNINQSEDIQKPVSLRRIPEILDFISNGEDSNLRNFTEQYVSAVNPHGMSIFGENWCYYSQGEALTPQPIKETVNDIYNYELQVIAEERNLRTAATDISQNSRI
jgi:arylsulfatase